MKELSTLVLSGLVLFSSAVLDLQTLSATWVSFFSVPDITVSCILLPERLNILWPFCDPPFWNTDSYHSLAVVLDYTSSSHVIDTNPLSLIFTADNSPKYPLFICSTYVTLCHSEFLDSSTFPSIIVSGFSKVTKISSVPRLELTVSWWLLSVWTVYFVHIHLYPIRNFILCHV